MDLRKRKSQEKLQNALAEHLQSKSLDEITIGELTETAGVSRQTFYSNFENKQSVLLSRISRSLMAVSDYFESIKYSTEMTRTEVVEKGVIHFLQVVEKERTLMTAAFSGQAGDLCLALAKEQLMKFISSRILIQFNHNFSDSELDIISDFYAGAFIGSVQGYLQDDTGRKTIEAVARNISMLMPHGLDGVIGNIQS